MGSGDKLKGMKAILLLFLVTANGQNARRILRAALDRYNNIKAISMSVSARETYSFDSTVDSVAYRFFFKSPNLVRYDFTAPDTGIMLVDGKRVWMYQPGDTVAYFSVLPSDTSSVETPFSSFRIVDSLLSLGFKFSEVETSGDTLMRIHLVPPDFADIKMDIGIEISLKDTLLSSITIEGEGFSNRTEYMDYVDAGDGVKLPQKVVSTRKHGDAAIKRVMIFRDVRVNAELPPSVFEFTPPHGVHIRMISGQPK